jgi:transposase-like protein
MTTENPMDTLRRVLATLHECDAAREAALAAVHRAVVRCVDHRYTQAHVARVTGLHRNTVAAWYRNSGCTAHEASPAA